MASGITADVNLDGKPDLIGFDGAVLLGKGDGTFTTEPKLSLTGPPLAVGDFTFQPAVTYAVGNSSYYLAEDGTVAADFNGDGKLDLAVLNTSDNTVSVLLGNGDGTFQPQITSATGVWNSRFMAARKYFSKELIHVTSC